MTSFWARRAYPLPMPVKEAHLLDPDFTPPPPHIAIPILAQHTHTHTRSRKSQLVWKIPAIDSTNREGSMEFTVRGNSETAFFPVSVAFTSTKTFAGIDVRELRVIPSACACASCVWGEMV